MYRFAFQGMETDKEVSGLGNSYTTEFRQYDPRLGRWKSLDPVFQPKQSPFCGLDNNPIWFIDPLGDKIIGTRRQKRALKKRADWQQIKENYKGRGKRDLVLRRVTDKVADRDNVPTIDKAEIQRDSKSGSDYDRGMDNLYHRKITKLRKMTFTFNNRVIRETIPQSNSYRQNYLPNNIGTDFTRLGKLGGSNIRGVLRKNKEKIISYKVTTKSAAVKFDDISGNTRPSEYRFFLDDQPFDLGDGTNLILGDWQGKLERPVSNVKVMLTSKLTVKSIRHSTNNVVDACNGYLFRLTLTMEKNFKKNKKNKKRIRKRINLLDLKGRR